MNKALFATIIAAALSLPIAAAAKSDGEKLYTPCKACHLANGNGVPGAFPPLKEQVVAFAKTEAGRAYLVLTINRGAIGRIKVDGKNYMGAMPAQARLKPDQIAVLLNYVATDVAGGEGLNAFTESEVKAILEAHPKARGRAVIALRPDPNAVPKETAPNDGASNTAAPKATETAAKPKTTPDDPSAKRWADHLAKRAEKS